jgi:hypothetical protein
MIDINTEQLSPLKNRLDDAQLEELGTVALEPPVTITSEQAQAFWKSEKEKSDQLESRFAHPVSYERRVEAGTAYREMALDVERESGLSDKAVYWHRRARTQFLGAIGLRPLPEDPRDVSTPTVDVDVLLMYADSTAKEARAENIAPYQDPENQRFDRRANLFRISEKTFAIAMQMMETGDNLTLDGHFQSV